MQQVWRERLKDSSWVTIAWDWFQTLLGRAVEGILWVTMVFSCYQLIPFAPQVAPGLSTFMFILQFIGLDVGGIGLNKLAQGQGLHKWSFVRVVSYVLIGITLITVAYAGIERTIKIDASTTFGIEVVLVVARSIMTVLYGQAIHSLKQQTKNVQVSIGELQERVDNLSSQLDTERERASTLQRQLDVSVQEVDTLRQSIVDAGQAKVVSSEQCEVDTEKTARVIRLDTNRLRKSGQDATTADNALVEQIRQLLKSESGLSGRAIAARLGCSPTTAGKWKTIIEQESGECMNE